MAAFVQKSHSMKVTNYRKENRYLHFGKYYYCNQALPFSPPKNSELDENAIWLLKAFKIHTGIVCLADLEQAVSLSPAPSLPAFESFHPAFPALIHLLWRAVLCASNEVV